MRDRRRYSFSTELPLFLSLVSCFTLAAVQGFTNPASWYRAALVFLGTFAVFLCGWAWGWTSYRMLGRKRETILLERRRQQQAQGI